MQKLTFRQIIAPEVRAEEGEGRRVTFVASDGTRDSAGTVLNQKGWKLDRFNKNGIIGYQHKVYGGWDDTDNPDNVIGKGHAYVKDDKLMVDIDFEPAEINPLAEKIYQKILFGSLRAVSVGFIPVGEGHWGKDAESISGKNPTYYYAGQELIEVSVVNIPANPNALKKSYIEQAIEDELAALRAQENPDTPVDDPDQRAAVAEFEKTLTLARAALQ